MLPHGYGLVFVLPSATFRENDKGRPSVLVCSDWSFIRISIAIAQVLFGVINLYRTKGRQIEQFGYAAYGFTVIPYTLTSLVNLTGRLLRPQYPTMYLVRSKVMAEAEEMGAIIDSVIARLDEDENDLCRECNPPENSLGSLRKRWRCVPVKFLPFAIKMIILWLLSDFRSGQSTMRQRVLSMA
jgi:hypothetical protein